MTIRETCDQVKRMVDRAITWEDDKDTVGLIEHWQSHAPQILADENYKTLDDCDGFALTAAELCVHYGISTSSIRLVFCEIPDLGYHLVCTVDDVEADKTWVFDNNEERIRDWKRIPYNWLRYMKYENLGHWFQIDD